MERLIVPEFLQLQMYIKFIIILTNEVLMCQDLYLLYCGSRL
jgi:hypothetical protein